MHPIILSISVLLLGANSAPAPKATGGAVYHPDIDLSKAPADYRKRVTEFRNILRKEPDRKAKVEKAIALANHKKSPYRRDAIDFLGEVRAREAIPALSALYKEEDLRDGVIYSLGRTGSLNAVPTLIKGLYDTNENVRGNSQHAIEKIVRTNFAYNYFDPVKKRNADAEQIRKWWNENRKTLRITEPTEEEKVAAEEAWEKYGKDYLNR